MAGHANVKDAAMAVSAKTYVYPLFSHICDNLPPLPAGRDVELGPPAATQLTRGDFQYFHYGCDAQQDQGWGCAYRTLQSMASWILNKRQWQAHLHVPSLREIQQTLVHIEDKPQRFVGSRDWIGAMEVFYTLDALYDVSCKILHVTKRESLRSHEATLRKYFQDYGGLVMMGGDMDAASKGIAGIHTSGKDMYLLVVDPHYCGVPASIDSLIDEGYIRWQNAKDFVDSSFYNLCLPYEK